MKTQALELGHHTDLVSRMVEGYRTSGTLVPCESTHRGLSEAHPDGVRGL